MLYETTVPNQNSNNLIKIAAVDSPELSYTGVRARHQATIAAVDSIIYKGLDGNTYTAQLGASYDSPAEAQVAIALVVEKRRADGGFGAMSKADNYDQGGIKVSDDLGNLKITIDADFEIVSYVNAGAATAVTRYTSTELVRDAYIEVAVGDVIGDVQYDGVKSALGSFTDAAALKTALDTALTAVGAESLESTVTENGSVFEIKITSKKYPILFAGVQMKNIKTYTGFFDGGSEVEALMAQELNAVEVGDKGSLENLVSNLTTYIKEAQTMKKKAQAQIKSLK